ncbi:MAG: hypothetical protein AAGB02_06405 [Pseudomonadota bacterium]
MKRNPCENPDLNEAAYGDPMRIFFLPVSALLLFLVNGCGQPATQSTNTTTKIESAAKATNDPLTAAINGEHRSADEKNRDQFRNPAQTLEFFGISSDMTVVEIWPGGGWYTNIIAPFLNAGGGSYYAAGFSRDGADERVVAALNSFENSFVEKPETYGQVVMTVLGPDEAIAPPGSADTVLTFRNVHNWQSRGSAPAHFAAFFDALKPGGVLGVVEHRADGNDALPRDGSSGYVFESDVVELAEAAGFELVARSDINANSADTKDHPFGVWTLPPVRRSSAVRGQEDPNFDRARYDAIGESDRMTLKFQKPFAADGALLE